MATNHAYNARLKAEAIKRGIKAAALRSKGNTWEEVGRLMGISRQRAQQLAAKAAP